jgi:hypothetical protein
VKPRQGSGVRDQGSERTARHGARFRHGLPRAAEVVVGEPCCHAGGDGLEPLPDGRRATEAQPPGDARPFGWWGAFGMECQPIKRGEGQIVMTFPPVLRA